MKKIRFLAALLVILMLPLGVLFGCNKPDEEPNDDPNEESGGQTPGGNKPSGGGNVSNVPADNDGNSGNGYLVMFNFDAAKSGNLKVDAAPYKRFFAIDSEKAGTSYVIKDKSGKNGTGALLMRREGTNAASNFSFKTDSLGSAFDSQHILEFDIKLRKGLLGDTLEVVADKKSKQVLISITPEGKVFDCDGILLYTADKLEAEWVHIAIAVDDSEREYVVYINGAKRTDNIAFSNKAYSSSEELEKYTFRLTGDTYDNTYCYFDNLAFVDGVIPKEYTSDDVIYRDYYTNSFDVFSASKVDANGNVLPNFEALINVYNTNDDATTKVNFDPYNSNSALSMNEMLTISKVDSDGNVEDVYTDYGVATGLYEYGEPVGGKLFVSGSGEDAKSIDFDSNKGLTFTAVDLLGDGATVTGVYQVYGSEAAPRIKLTFGDDFDQLLYCQINDGVISVYNDERFETLKTSGYVCVSQPFNKIEYSYSDDTTTISILVNEFTGKASLAVKNETLDINVTDATFVYDADDTKKLTVTTVDNGDFEFIYGEEGFSYTVDGYDEKTLTKTVKEEYIPAEEAENYKYALKYTNFKSGLLKLKFNVDMTNFNKEQWRRFRFEYYITEEMANDSYQFLIRLDAGKAADGNSSYLSKAVTHSVPGWYTIDFTFDELDVTRNATWEIFSGNIFIEMSSWKNGTISDPGKAADGYSLLIRNVQFVSDIAVVVDGPDAPAEGEEPCEHIDEEENSLFEPVEGRIDSTCTVGGYAIVKCSKCNATKIDKTKPITEPNGHDYTDAEIFVKECTCVADGYKYRYCNTCGTMEKTEKIVSPGHDFVDEYDVGKNALVFTCRVCAYETEVQFSNEMLVFADKIKDGGLASSNYFYVSDSVNSALNVGSFDASSNITYGLAKIVYANAKATAEKLDDGTYGIKFQRKPGVSAGSYIDLLLTKLSKRLVKGERFVWEFDFRLGGADKNGNYPQMTSSIIERTTGSGKFTRLFSIDENGVLSFENDSSATIAFSAQKFTNVALVFKPDENAIDVYVDGYREYTVPFGASGKEDYIATMEWSEIRFTYSSSETAAEGQYQYINNLAVYATEEYPICVRGLDSSMVGVTEHRGNIILKDKDGAENATYPLDVVDADKVLRLPDDINTSKYTLEFKLSADTALVDGVLLMGQKRDKNKMDNNILPLLTVEKGWLYFCDTAIADLSDIANGIKVKMVFNEAEGGADVYVNDANIPGGFIYYPVIEDITNMYTDPDSRIKSFTFDSEVGAYTVSELKLEAKG